MKYIKLIIKAKKRNEGEVWTQPSGRVVTKKAGKIIPFHAITSGDHHTDDKVIDKYPSKKSSNSQFLYQVKQGRGESTRYVKYKTKEAYEKDYPNGPKKGHVILNPVLAGVDNVKESKKIIKEINKKQTSKGQEIIRTGTSVVAEYMGKTIHGKVVGTKSIGKKGAETKGAATHYIIEYTKAEQSTGDERGKKSREKTLTINVSKDKVRRQSSPRKERSLLESDKAEQEKLAKKMTAKLSGALTRLSARDSQEFHDKAKELIGDFWDKKNPIHKIVAKKVAAIVAGMTAKGQNPLADLSHKNLMEIGLTGVYQAILDYNPEKGANIKTFLQSDKVKDYITTELKDALMIERGVIHKMSYDTKKAVALMKQLKDEMGSTLEGVENKDIINEYEKRYGNKKKLNLKKILDLAGTRRVSNIVDSMDESGEINITDRQASTVKTPETVMLEEEKMNALPKKMEAAMKGRLPGGVSAKTVADIMQYRYRVDESTTGKGVYGERSIYYNNPSNADDVAGKRLSYTQDAAGNPVRSWEEVAKRYGISTTQAERLFNHGSTALREALKENDQNAKELVTMMFNKSKEWRRKDFSEWLIKSKQKQSRTIQAQRMLYVAIGNQPFAANADGKL